SHGLLATAVHFSRRTNLPTLPIAFSCSTFVGHPTRRLHCRSPPTACLKRGTEPRAQTIVCARLAQTPRQSCLDLTAASSVEGRTHPGGARFVPRNRPIRLAWCSSDASLSPRQNHPLWACCSAWTLDTRPSSADENFRLHDSAHPRSWKTPGEGRPG